MEDKKLRGIYLLIGTGCGIIISGVLMVVVGLGGMTEINELERSYENQISALTNQLDSTKQELAEMQNALLTPKEVAEEGSSEQMMEDTIGIEDLSNVKNSDDINEVQVTYKEITIPNVNNSTDIARYLEEQGIVESYKDFEAYLFEQDATRKLRTGVKILPVLGEYNEIMNILTGK